MPARMRSISVARAVLVANLMSGAVLLLPLAALGAWRLEALTWISPWLANVAIWTVVGYRVLSEGDPAGADPSVWGGPVLGLVVATPLYLLWQLGTLATRRLLTWTTGAPRVVVPTEWVATQSNAEPVSSTPTRS